MIIDHCEQLSDSWFAARCGIPSASNFDKIITATGKPSGQSQSYMNTLLAEWITGEKAAIKQSEWMTRGIELEGEAREVYTFMTDREVDEVGLVFKDEKKLVSCSPDGLTEAGGLEIKCPAPGTHVGYLLGSGIPTTYIPQVQGSMWVSGLPKWDFVSYCPGMKTLIITVKRDEKMMDAFDEIMDKFLTTMLEKRERLTEVSK